MAQNVISVTQLNEYIRSCMDADEMLSGVAVTGTEIGVLVVGSAVSFLVSMLVIKALMGYVRKHTFSLFGVYRILLGMIVLAYFFTR